MEKKADVKAIMARFNTGGNEVVSGGRPAFSSGSSVLSKKVSLESVLSAGSTASTPPPKSATLKSTASTKSAPEARDLLRNRAPELGQKASGSKPGRPQEDVKPLFPKQPPFKPKPTESQDTEPKAVFLKSPPQKPVLSAKLSNPKPSVAKPPPIQTKPPWVKDISGGEEGEVTGPASPPPKSTPTPTPKPKSSITAMRSHMEEGSLGENCTKPYPSSTLKAPGFRAAQSAFNKEGSENGGKPVSSNDSSTVWSPAAKKPSIVRKPPGSARELENDDPSAPKRNQLPNIFALGTAPSKPNRPPKVNLEKFNKDVDSTSDVSGQKKANRPNPPAFHPSNSVAPPLPSQPSAPSLPPRPPGAIIQPNPDDSYDDVGVLNNPPPLPVGGHPSQKPEESGSDEEMYEDLDERWSSLDQKEQEKKREKEEKKRLEQEKKEQKERERKEQEARKRFKISGPVRVLHMAKARVDTKGSKTDLVLKQGESVDIIRTTDNPEGRWLGRKPDGSYGYVKTEIMEIDFDSLKRQGSSMPPRADPEPEVYDDVSDLESVKGQGVVLPPPPGEEGDIYDDLDDPNLDVSLAVTEPKPSASKSRSLLRMLKGWDDWRKNADSDTEVPPPAQFTPEGSTDKPVEAITEDIYDDVDSHDFPSTPSVPSMDPKRQKKFEKEEKDFRKKFKFDGEIKVLNRVTVLSTLTCKKWGSKDLPLKAGEELDVVVKPANGKMICRNEEGKLGYVSVSHITDAEDGDIYDDIGDDCIYDND